MPPEKYYPNQVQVGDEFERRGYRIVVIEVTDDTIRYRSYSGDPYPSGSEGAVSYIDGWKKLLSPEEKEQMLIARLKELMDV